MFGASGAGRGRLEASDAAVVGQFAPERRADLVHPGAVSRFRAVLEAALVVDVVHGARRQFRVAELVIRRRIFEAGAPVAVEESGDVLAGAVGPDDRSGVRTQLRRHDVLPVAGHGLAAVGRSVVISTETEEENLLLKVAPDTLNDLFFSAKRHLKIKKKKRKTIQRSLMAELVSHGVGQRESRVLVDAAGSVGLAHSGHFRQAEGAARLIGPGADVVPGAK